MERELAPERGHGGVKGRRGFALSASPYVSHSLRSLMFGRGRGLHCLLHGMSVVVSSAVLKHQHNGIGCC